MRLLSKPHYKKLTFKLTALAACFSMAVCFAENPLSGQPQAWLQNQSVNLKKASAILASRRSTVMTKLSGPLVGSLPGKFEVTPAGAASYAIAIDTPPGTAGMAPKISISYNSQAKNGLLGVGFSLTGLSAITRIPQNIAQNGKIHGVNFTNEDRFALNGQQLVAIKGEYGANGTEYRTYNDTYTKIVSYGNEGNGPEYFKV